MVDMSPEPEDSPRLDAERHLLLMMIIWNLENPKRSVTEIWHPPMTSDGRQISVASEVERLVRKVWTQSVPPKPPRFRSPLPSEDPVEHRRLENARADVLLESRARFRFALEQILYSDAAFETFPALVHGDLRR